MDEGLVVRRVAELVRKGEYDLAYFEAQSLYSGGHLSTGAFPLASSALLAGEHRWLQTVLVGHIRQNDATLGDYYLHLSAAIALQGRVFPGQGEYAFKRLGEAAGGLGWPDTEIGRLNAPTTAKETAVANILALGLSNGAPYSTAYLEWALKLEPRCEIAGKRLIEEYMWTGKADKAERVASSMIRALAPDRLRTALSLGSAASRP